MNKLYYSIGFHCVNIILQKHVQNEKSSKNKPRANILTIFIMHNSVKSFQLANQVFDTPKSKTSLISELASL